MDAQDYIDTEITYSRERDTGYDKLKGAYGKAEEASKKKKKKKDFKLYGKPKVKIPSYSPRKLLLGMGASQGALVREVPEREIVEDHRSLFFKNEITGEKKWLLK